MLVKMWGKRNPYTPLLEIKSSAASMEISARLLKKLKTELPCDSALPVPDTP
jgi:hypothetical protein